MDFQTWAAFAATSALVLVTPGPTVVAVVACALARGRGAALPLACGTALADATMMTLSLAGVGAVLAVHAALFEALRWTGAAYLAWLGLGLARARAVEGGRGPGGGGRLALAAQAWLAVALNPLSLAFFVAFLPQFVDPGRPFWRQALLLEATFIGLAVAVTFAYALGAARLGAAATSGAALALRRVGGAALVGAALWLAVGGG